MFKVGSVVKFKSPQSHEEESECFAVLELRGERVLVRCIGAAFGDWSIKPEAVYLSDDLTLAEPELANA